MVFRGISAISLDLKSRIIMPSRYREALQNDETLVLTIDTEDKCLLLYPLKVWEEIEAKVALLPSFNPLTRRIQRLLIGHATEVTMDNNGRLLIPTLLREYAKIDKQVMLVGQGKKFELWGKENWENARNEWLNQGIEDTQGGLPQGLQELAL